MISLVAVALLSAVASSTIKVDPKTRHFVDEHGRSRIFHGFNAVVKKAPYLPLSGRFDPQMSIVEEDIQNFKDWGINIIRLGVMWESVEVAPK